jgi:hypothetical protein
VGTSSADWEPGTASSSDDIAALAAEFPGWHIWHSRSRRGAETGWHATRKRRGMRKGARLAADAAGLRPLLAQEESLGAA